MQVTHSYGRKVYKRVVEKETTMTYSESELGTYPLLGKKFTEIKIPEFTPENNQEGFLTRINRKGKVVRPTVWRLNFWRFRIEMEYYS